MMLRPSVLYIPGLGGADSIDKQQSYIHFLNKRLGRNIQLFDPLWETDEPYAQKYARLIAAYKKHGNPKSVFAVSAGASLAIRLTADQPQISQTYTIAGKLVGSSKIGPNFSNRAPALIDAVKSSEEAIANTPNLSSRITSFRPIFYDGTLDLIDMRIPDSQGAHIIPIPGHVPVIITSLATVLPWISR